MVEWEFCDNCGTDEPPIVYDKESKKFLCEKCTHKRDERKLNEYKLYP